MTPQTWFGVVCAATAATSIPVYAIARQLLLNLNPELVHTPRGDPRRARP